MTRSLQKSLLIPLLVVTAAAGFLEDRSLAADASAPAGEVLHLKRFGETAETLGRQFVAQNDLNLKPEENYTLTFWAKASSDRSLRIAGKLSQPPWATVGTLQQVDLTQDWQKFEVPLDAKGSVPGHTRLSFLFATPEPGDVWIADLHLRSEAGGDSDNLLSNAQFAEGLTKWYMEGKREGAFLVEVQTLAQANGASGEAKN